MTLNLQQITPLNIVSLPNILHKIDIERPNSFALLSSFLFAIGSIIFIKVMSLDTIL